MRLWRERAAFSALLGRLGGMAKVYRRGWARGSGQSPPSAADPPSVPWEVFFWQGGVG